VLFHLPDVIELTGVEATASVGSVGTLGYKHITGTQDANYTGISATQGAGYTTITHA